jgi:hypothetical protein
MHKLNLSIVIFLLFQGLAFTEAKAQELMISCSRTTIESYSGNEKQPVLRYLDEARQVADKFMRLLAENKFDEIYKLHKDMKILVIKKSNSGAAVPMSLEAVSQEYGQITSYEYRHQSLLYLLNGPIELRGTVGTWYAVKTANTVNGDLYMHVGTYKYHVEDSSHLLSGVLRERNDKSPEWEYNNSPQKTCNGMKEELKVKIL